jgi:hypothetical protein
MKKLFLLGIFCAISSLHGAHGLTLSKELNVKSSCNKIKPPCCLECAPTTCPPGPRGCKGPKGKKGARGEKGRKGPTSEPLIINDVIEVTTRSEALLDPNALIAFNPIINSVNGLTASLPGGLSLVESVPFSGNFDTITLPIEPRDTFYSVSYGVSISENSGDFQLVLNGTPLVYTTLSVIPFQVLISQTSVIRNPANTAGTLSLISLDENTLLFPPTEISFSAYITVIKLNQNP